MSHSHHHHCHDHHHQTDSISDTGLAIAVAVNLLLTVVEVVAALVSGSLALFADALHNFSDCASLIVAWIARRVSKKGPDASFTFGYRRAELIGATINLTALIVLGFYLLIEAIMRAFSPQEIEGGIVMWVSGLAIVIDLVTAFALLSFSKSSLNIKAAFLHNLTDAVSSVAVLLGGAAIMYWGWNWIDVILTFLISGYILALSLPMLKKAVIVLMDGVEVDVDISKIHSTLESNPSVCKAYHIHVRQIDESLMSIEATISVSAEGIMNIESIKKDLKNLLKDRFDILHSTLEFEIAPTEKISSGSSEDPHSDCGYPVQGS